MRAATATPPPPEAPPERSSSPLSPHAKAVTRAAVSSKVAARRERRYEKLRTIGSGTFGTAHLVRRRGDPPAPRGLSERRLVLKKIRLARMTDAQRAQSYEEMALLMRFQCPGVLRHVESWVERGCYVCVVTAFYERGDLLAQLQAARNDDAVAGFDESLLAEWLVAVGTGLEQMHAAGCLHRDVKSSNIFLGADGLPALGDFGLACQLPEGETLAQPGECVGTPNYMSPELVQDRPYGDKSDVWALGCVFFELTALKPAFMAFDMRGLKAKIVAAKLPALPQEYSSEWRSLVRSMLAADPQRRPSMREVLQSAVLAEAAERFRVKVAEAQEREKKEETLWERLRAEAAEARAQAAEKAAEAKAEAGKAGEGSPGATQKEKLPKVWGGGGFGLQDKGFRGAARTRAAGSAVIAAAKITPFEVRRAAAREARQESRRTRQSPSPSLQPNGGDDGRGGRLGRQSPSPRVGVGGAGGSARITRAASASSHNPRTTPSSTSAERPPRLARRTPGVAHRSSATSASTPASAARARSARASHSSHKKAGVAGASALLSKRSPKDRRPPSGKPPRSVPKAMPRASAAAPKPAPAVPRPAAKGDKVPTKTPSASKPAKTRTALPEVKSPSPQPRGAQRRTPVASSQARTAAARRVAVAAAAREAEAAAARRAENIARSAAGATASKPWRAAMKEAPTIEQMLKAGGGRLGAGGGNAYLAYARYAKAKMKQLTGARRAAAGGSGRRSKSPTRRTQQLAAGTATDATSPQSQSLPLVDCGTPRTVWDSSTSPEKGGIGGASLRRLETLQLQCRRTLGERLYRDARVQVGRAAARARAASPLTSPSSPPGGAAIAPGGTAEALLAVARRTLGEQHGELLAPLLEIAQIEYSQGIFA